MRIPFSFYLLPVFLLAVAVAEERDLYNLVLSFIILHLFVYPASNGFNSYFDKDEDSIGGLKNPPKVTKELYTISLIFDLLGLLLGLLISIEFTLMIFIYGMISKAYSHPSIRLKKFPIIGWLAAGVFQGYFTFLLCIVALQETSVTESFEWNIQLPAILSSVLLLGSYPMTQIYQHDEDARRGDLTMSRLLGILGTFHFTAIAFTLASAGFVYYFVTYSSPLHSLLYLLFLSPVLGYFGWWYLKVRTSLEAANFVNTMRLNFISSLMLNLFFVYLWVS